MEIKDYIGVYKNFLTPLQVSGFLKTFSNYNFTNAKVFKPSGAQEEDITIRRVADYNLSHHRSLTETHWINFIKRKIFDMVDHFSKLKEIHPFIRKMNEITILKYEKGGFYTPHVDGSPNIPRELSVIIFLNNDYEGGNLVFYEPNLKDVIMDIKPEPGKAIIWPSNYLFPHAAAPVIKGTRFVIVSWMS